MYFQSLIWATQNWQGNHKFFCDGRIISGPELSPAAMIAVATAAPGITFAAFT